jgi:hypothetical protein
MSAKVLILAIVENNMQSVDVAQMQSPTTNSILP